MIRIARGAYQKRFIAGSLLAAGLLMVANASDLRAEDDLKTQATGSTPTTQQTARATADSLRELQDQYQTKVESGSKYRVRLSGIVLLNMYGNRGAVDNQDFPGIARDRGTLDSAGAFADHCGNRKSGFKRSAPISPARTRARIYDLILPEDSRTRRTAWPKGWCVCGPGRSGSTGERLC